MKAFLWIEAIATFVAANIVFCFGVMQTPDKATPYLAAAAFLMATSISLEMSARDE